MPIKWIVSPGQPRKVFRDLAPKTLDELYHPCLLVAICVDPRPLWHDARAACPKSKLYPADAVKLASWRRQFSVAALGTLGMPCATVYFTPRVDRSLAGPDRVAITSGRHQINVAIERGYRQIVVAVPDFQAQLIGAYFGAETVAASQASS